LNKLATSGAVEDMLALGRHLSTKIKKDVSYDNRLCNAYLSAGRGAEFLDILVRDLAMAVRSQDPEKLHIIQERFPRGGAMGLLDNHPELLDKVSGQALVGSCSIFMRRQFRVL
jgi:leucine-rich PPR motif-containing protein